MRRAPWLTPTGEISDKTQTRLNHLQEAAQTFQPLQMTQFSMLDTSPISLLSRVINFATYIYVRVDWDVSKI